jgi:hypothetical protein
MFLSSLADYSVLINTEMNICIDSRAALWADIDGDDLEDAIVCWKGKEADVCEIYKRTSGNALSSSPVTTLELGSNSWERPMSVETKRRGNMADLVVAYQKLTLDEMEGDGYVVVWEQENQGSFHYTHKVVPTSLDQPWTVAVGEDGTIFVSSQHRGLGVIAVTNF